MSFRLRLLVAFAAVVAIPIVVLAIGTRRSMTTRLTEQYAAQVQALVAIVAEDLESQGTRIAGSLEALAEELRADNRFRRAVLADGTERSDYILDYAPRAMRLVGLSLLQLHDEEGTISSSGHFRNDYGRRDPGLVAALARLSGDHGARRPALVRARTAEGELLALVRAAPVDIGPRRLTLVGGIEVNRALLRQLGRGSTLEVSLQLPDMVLSSDPDLEAELRALPAFGVESEPQRVELPGRVVAEVVFPFVSTTAPAGGGPGGELASARILVSRSLDPLLAMQRNLSTWILAAAAATGLAALVAALWLASRISRPLAHLARQTETLDLDRLDVDFASRRRDEIGRLANLLDAMTARLRASAEALRQAERRAALGELARQVNHDIKNGLAPIRNVVRHLAQLGRDRPEEMPAVFAERQTTLQSSIDYLDDLARQYARLAPRSERKPVDVNAVARRVVADARSGSAERRTELRTELCAEACVLGDTLAVRRILENLVGNALDSLEGEPRRVTVRTESLDLDGEGPRLRITVEDTGCGMSEEERHAIFRDFYTTKENGTGLGLSIVRRIVLDLDGTLEVASEPGRGSRFTVELPRSRPEGGESDQEVTR